MKYKLDEIQILRAIAAILVVLAHCHTDLIPLYGQNNVKILTDKFFPDAATGVVIFFIISGFIMAVTTKDTKPQTRSVSSFYVRRLIRILPIYYIFLSISAIYPPYEGMYHIIGSFLFLPFTGTTAYPILPIGWTLVYEMYFYLIFGLSLLFPKRMRLWIVCTWYILNIAFSPTVLIAGPHNLPINLLGVFTNPITFNFVFGLFFAYAYINLQYRKMSLMYFAILLVLMICFANHRSWIAMAIIMTCFALSHVYSLYLKIKGSCCLIGGSPYSLYLSHLWSLYLKIKGFCCLIGDSSYSLYLSHLYSLYLAGKCWRILRGGKYLGDDILILFGFITSIFIGLLSYFCLEKPLTRVLRNKLMRC